MSDFYNDRGLQHFAGHSMSIACDRPGVRGLEMGESLYLCGRLVKTFRRLEFCCIILHTGMLCTSDKPYLVSLGLKGFCQVWCFF